MKDHMVPNVLWIFMAWNTLFKVSERILNKAWKNRQTCRLDHNSHWCSSKGKLGRFFLDVLMLPDSKVSCMGWWKEHALNIPFWLGNGWKREKGKKWLISRLFTFCYVENTGYSISLLTSLAGYVITESAVVNRIVWSSCAAE